MVPFCKPDIRPEDAQAVADVIASGWLTTGPNCSRLEQQLAERIGVDYVCLTSSLTSAVAPLLSAIFEGRTRRLRAVFPTWTFSSVPMEFVHMGFEVHLVDVDPETLMIPVQTYPWADVIVPTHLFGNQVDVRRLKKINPQAVVIDDAAHLAPDSRDISPCHASLYSFYATKPLCTGEGGAIATNDPIFAKRFKQARLHGISKDAFGRYSDPTKVGSYDVIRPGWKANMLDSCAALGLSMLPRLDRMRDRRKEIVEQYGLAFESLKIEMISHQQGSSYHLAACRLPAWVNRTQFQKDLANHGIVTGVHFTPLHRMTYWSQQQFGFSPDQLRGWGTAAGEFPVAEANAERVMSLPLSSAMTEADVVEVIRAVWDVFPVGGYGTSKKTTPA
jgi:dTDP-4-amino-4,6-dideoxygalactose transaminase